VTPEQEQVRSLQKQVRALFWALGGIGVALAIIAGVTVALWLGQGDTNNRIASAANTQLNARLVTVSQRCALTGLNIVALRHLGDTIDIPSFVLSERECQHQLALLTAQRGKA
jgi:Na+/H+-translocating membrane pyrophosphatase